jgi:hypothetical protein
MKTRGIRRIQEKDTHRIQEEVHDPYKPRKKPHEPCLCPQCGAVNLSGRWQWAKEKPEHLQEEICPACHRINDEYPAGEIILSGGFLETHKHEIVELTHNTERAERAEHPLQRIMDIDETGGKVTVTTTDIHLARRIGHAVFDAYKGHLDTHYDPEGYYLRMTWRRDD